MSIYCALVVEGVKVISGVKVYTIGEEAAILFTLIPTHHEIHEHVLARVCVPQWLEDVWT